MAKKYGKKQYIGNINKTKDGKSRYLKISKDIDLKKGQFINLESVDDQVKGYEEAYEAGRLSEDHVTERIAELRKSQKEYGLLFTLTYQEVTEE